MKTLRLHTEQLELQLEPQSPKGDAMFVCGLMSMGS